jgi:hypothetical protein
MPFELLDLPTIVTDDDCLPADGHSPDIFSRGSRDPQGLLADQRRADASVSGVIAI